MTRTRRGASALGLLAVAIGVLLIADVATTLVWQEPLSALRGWHAQHQLSRQLDEALVRVAPDAALRRRLQALPDAASRMALVARRLRERTPDGAALGRISLPSQGRHYVLVDGDSPSDLRKGPGAYPQTVLPGEGGTTAIAGHRTTYLAPFRDIDKLADGDHVIIDMPYGRFDYAVTGHVIVDPDDTSVVRGNGRSRLVLTACNPLYSAAQRIVVFARLIHANPDAKTLAIASAARR